ncbi:MAG: ATP-binding protein [Bacteroidia bacterium]
MKKKLKVLHLEDVDADAELVERALLKGGLQFEILVVDNKIDFIKALEEFLPDLILCDHSLPSFNSIEAITIVKEMKLHIPFILVTATISEESAIDVMLGGADDYILKDRMARLPNSIERVLEKHRLENEQKQSEKERERLLDIIQKSLNEIFMFNPETLLFEYVNDEALKHLRYTKEEILKLTPLDIYPDLNEKTFREMLSAIEHSAVMKKIFETSHLRKDKTHYDAEVHLQLIEQETGKTFLAMSMDITQRKKAERETLQLVNSLQSKNKELGQFAYIVSHNLRAPIAKILGIASVFDTGNENPSNTELLECIVQEVTNLDNVVVDINTIISTRDSINDKIDYVYFDAKLKLIEQVLKNQITESKAAITSDFKNSERVLTVKSYLYSIMFNLLSNAIKYRLPGVPLNIHLQTERVADFICLSVKDNGMGIDLKKYGEKLFGLYKRFHGNAIEGKGIGLNLVKMQVDSLGGKVEVESNINHGSTFKVYFPIIQNGDDKNKQGAAD